MTEPIYVFQCPSCDEFTDGQNLKCDHCAETVKRSWAVVVTDGAPTTDIDPAEARGFRAGQEHGIAIEQERILALIEQHTFKYNDNHIMFLQRDELIRKIKGL